jgi:hypothetical protein
VLEPNGTFYVEAIQPTVDQRERILLMEAIERLSHEVQEMRTELAALRGQS